MGKCSLCQTPFRYLTTSSVLSNTPDFAAGSYFDTRHKTQHTGTDTNAFHYVSGQTLLMFSECVMPYLLQHLDLSFGLVRLRYEGGSVRVCAIVTAVRRGATAWLRNHGSP